MPKSFLWLIPNNNKIICPQHQKITYETSELPQSYYLLEIKPCAMVPEFEIWHTSSNLIYIGETRASSNSSKNHSFLMYRIWKMGRNLFSSLAIKDNLKVAYLEKMQWYYTLLHNSNVLWQYLCLQCSLLNEQVL